MTAGEQAAPFTGAWWLPGAHLHTVWRVFTGSRTMVSFRRERLDTPDGDELLLDHADISQEAPRVILLHGLEGSSYSVYIQGVAAEAVRRGCNVTAVNFRSCARDPRDRRTPIMNLRPRMYHSGETSDFDLVVRTLARRSSAPLLAFGASLGGNVLLKWLGENPGQTLLRRGAAISVPFDLGAGSRYLEKGLGRLYVARFLATLRPKALDLLARFPQTPIDREGMLRARTFRQFDDAANAPLHGFRDADDYYDRASSIRVIGRIDTPVLAISAENDPFLPPEVLREVEAVKSAAVRLVTTKQGGHVGFVSGHPWRYQYWYDKVVLDWLLDSGAMSV